ncbi:hypothetical protein [Kribbia dieselivorans]|uniref:hypothetical protein n=1 Tax=Kribbia dieselivorans TaxID=331526 RepID=UPI0012EEA233|nr:hypothetical protein [Kribbia dieselivorans]
MRGRAALAAVAVVAAGSIGFALGHVRLGSPPVVTAQAQPVTATVDKGALADTVSMPVEITAPWSHAITPTGDGGVAVLTSPAPSAGSTVGQCTVILTVNDAPVFVVPGQTRPYRDLRQGTRGPDALRLNASLGACGLDTDPTSDRFTTRTAAAMAALAARERPMTSVAAWQLVMVPSGVAALRAGSTSAQVGEAIPNGKPAITITGQSTGLTATVGPNTARRLKAGVTARIRFDDGTTISGTIDRVVMPTGDGKNADSGPPDGEVDPQDLTRGRDATVTFTHSDRDLQKLPDAGGGTATITLGRSPATSLHVPLAALEPCPDGGTCVRVHDGDDSRLVPVTAGLSAGARVVVTPRVSGDLAVGDRVEVRVGQVSNTPRDGRETS